MRYNSRTKEVEEDLTLPTSYAFVCEINLKAQEIESEYHTCAHGHINAWSMKLGVGRQYPIEAQSRSRPAYSNV